MLIWGYTFNYERVVVNNLRLDHIVLTKSSGTTISKTGKLFLSFSWNSTALEEEEIYFYHIDVLKQKSQGMLIRSRCLSGGLKFS